VASSGGNVERAFVRREVEGFVRSRMQEEEICSRWETPLVGFADAADELFERLKEVVQSSHAMPSDVLPDARTVVVYFLPFTKEIGWSNRDGYHASREWAVAYVETNQLIVDLHRYLSTVLRRQGFHAAELPPTYNFDPEQLMSDWSHRHVAYIAGLGTFGLHNLLITDRGCCGRFGSLVTDAGIEPTERPDTHACLYKHNGSCRACIEKCVTGALTEEFFDRHKCFAVQLENADIFKDEGVAHVCGKCSTVVPCSFENPVRKAVNKAAQKQ